MGGLRVHHLSIWPIGPEKIKNLHLLDWIQRVFKSCSSRGQPQPRPKSVSSPNIPKPTSSPSRQRSLPQLTDRIRGRCRGQSRRGWEPPAGDGFELLALGEGTRARSPKKVEAASTQVVQVVQVTTVMKASPDSETLGFQPPLIKEAVPNIPEQPSF